MEYRKLIEASKKLNKNNDINTNRVILTNPVEKYNFVIDQYDKEYNKINNIELKRIPLDRIYYHGYIMENGICSFLIIFFVIPSTFLAFNKLIIPNIYTNDIIFYILSIYFSSIFFLALLTIIIYLYAKKVYNDNHLLVRNPFMKMIFLPELCRLLNVINKHFQINEEEIKIFNFSEIQKNNIKEHNIDNKYRFMIYDQNFVDYYSELGNLKLLLKHVLWVLASIAIYFSYFFFINLF